MSPEYTVIEQHNKHLFRKTTTTYRAQCALCGHITQPQSSKLRIRRLFMVHRYMLHPVSSGGVRFTPPPILFFTDKVGTFDRERKHRAE